FTVTVTVRDNLNVSGSATFTVNVSDPAVVASAVSFGASVNQAFANQAVATFTDPGGAEPNNFDSPGSPISNHYTATIDWGDGTFPPTAGTITVSGNVFTVRGGHTY